MTRTKSHGIGRDRPSDSPIAWFGEFLLALDRGNYPRASEAQRQLSRLGFIIRHRPLKAKGGAR